MRYFLFLATLVLSLGACQQREAMPQVSREGEWVTYDNDSFVVEAPIDWEMDYSGRVGTAFILFAPEDAEGDAFRENVNLIQEFTSGHTVDLKGYTDQAVEVLKEYMTDLKDLKVEERNDGMWLSYSGLQGNYRLNMLQRITMKGDVVSIITYTSREGESAAHDRFAEQIIASFRLK